MYWLIQTLEKAAGNRTCLYRNPLKRNEKYFYLSHVRILFYDVRQLQLKILIIFFIQDSTVNISYNNFI